MGNIIFAYSVGLVVISVSIGYLYIAAIGWLTLGIGLILAALVGVVREDNKK